MGRWMKLLALLVFILFVITSTTYFTLTSKTTCIDPSCITKGCEIKSVMNDKVGPCKEFKTFSCGNSGTSLTSRIFNEFDQNLKVYEEQVFDIPSEGCEDALLDTARTLYEICYGGEDLEELSAGDMLLLHMVTRNYSKSTNFAIEDYEFYSKTQGFTAQSLFSTYLYQTKHPNDTAIYIDYPIHAFIDPRVVLKSLRNNDKLKEEYKFYLQSYWTDLRLDDEDNATVISAIIDLEIKLATILETHKSQHETNLRTNIVTLSKRFPYFSWEYYFKKTYPKVNLHRKKIVVRNEKYLIDIKTLFEDKYVLILYMFYRNFYEIMQYAFESDPKPDPYNPDDPYPDNIRLVKFLKDLGVPRFTDKQQFCKALTYRLFGSGLTSLIIERFSIQHGGQDIIKDMIQNIKDSFNESISKLTWMDRDTKHNVMKRIAQIKHTISLSDNLLETLSNPLARHTYYTGYCLSDYRFFIDRKYEILKIQNYLNRKNNELFYRKKSAFDEIIRPRFHGIVYDQNENELIVPVGVLQPHIFDLYWPPYLHYAGIGSAISRVLIQGFHNMIRQNSEEKQSKIWWSKYTKDKYDRKRDQCLAYSGLFGLNTEGKSYMNEVLDEIEGMNLAFRAYMRSKSKYYFDDAQLDEFEQYTSEQMFFISYGNWFCSSRPQFSLISSITKPFKTPLDIIHKNKNFKDAFGCGTSSYDSKFSRTCMFW